MSAAEAWRTMTGPQYMDYLDSLLASESGAKVVSAAELFTDKERAEVLAELAAQGARYVERINDAATARRELILKHSGPRAAKQFERFALGLQTADRFASKEDTEAEWQIPNLVPRTGSGLHSGASGALKSFAEIWIGDQVNRNGGKSVLVIAEGARGFKRRLRAYSEHTGIPLSELPAVLPFAVDLSDTDSVVGFVGALKVLHPDVTYVAFDTKWRCSGSAEENSATDQAKLFANVDTIVREFNCFVMLVAHLGKTESLGVRGSNSQYAAVDIELRQERQVATCTLRTEKCKDGRDDIIRTFDIVEVDLGRNARGESESSLVLVESDAVAGGPLQKPEGKHEHGLMEILRASATHTMHENDLIEEHLQKQGGGRVGNIRDRALKSLLAKGLVFRHGEHTISLASAVLSGGGEKDWLGE
jgi:hypothetical protein